jgi:hypothetical protein
MRIDIDPKALPHHNRSAQVGTWLTARLCLLFFLLSWFRGSGKNAVGFN